MYLVYVENQLEVQQVIFISMVKNTKLLSNCRNKTETHLGAAIWKL